jgi:hypothetical protein
MKEEAKETPTVQVVGAPKKRSPRKQKSSEEVKSLSIRKTPSDLVPVSPIDRINGWITTAMDSSRSMDDIQKFIDMRNAELARIARLEFLEAKTTFTGKRKRIVKKNEADFGTNKEGRQGAKYKFEDLDDIDDAVKDLAAEVGFSWEWKTRYDGDWVYIKCILSHAGGHFESDEMRGKPDQSGNKNVIQADSSTSTYLMRYTLKKVLGIASGRDDDGKGGAAPINQERAKSKRFNFDSVLKAVQDKKITAQEAEETYDLTAEQIETIRLF